MSPVVKAVLFTHPTCVGCGEAYRRLQKAEKTLPELDFTVQSLAGRTGQELARKWNVHSVPTVVFNDDPDLRIVGIPSEETLQSMVDELRESQG